MRAPLCLIELILRRKDGSELQSSWTKLAARKTATLFGGKTVGCFIFLFKMRVKRCVADARFSDNVLFVLIFMNIPGKRFRNKIDDNVGKSHRGGVTDINGD